MKKHTKKRMPLAAWIGFGLAAVLLVFNGYTVAKYIAQRETEPVYAAKNFYFESDLLSEEGKTYTLKTGVDQISFILMNHPDALRKAQVDISYEIWVDGAKCTDYTGDDGTLKMTEDDVQITLPELSAGEHTVEARATGPYVKTLKGTFIIEPEDKKIAIAVNDAAGDPALLLTVTTTDFEGQVTIQWPNTVLPNNADPLLKNARGTTCTVDLEKNSQYTFTFFKTNPYQTCSGSLYNNTITISLN